MKLFSEQIEKIPRVEVEKELASVGVSSEAIDGILGTISLKSLQELEGITGYGFTLSSDIFSGKKIHG